MSETLVGLLESELERYHAERGRTSVYLNRRCALNQAREYLGETTLDEIDSVDWSGWIAWMCDERGLRASTANIYHALVSRMLEDARQRGVIEKNPARWARKRVDWRLVYKKRSGVEPTRLPAFIDECLSIRGGEPRYYYGPLVAFAALTGCRLGEMLGLTWDCVDLESRRVAIVGQLQSISGKMAPPKSNAGYRTIVVCRRAIDALKLQKRQVRMLRQRAPRRRGDPDVVFPAKRGRPMRNADPLRQDLRRICERTDTETMTMHQLRHTYATTQLSLGADLPSLAKLLGHAKITTTVDIYGHLTDKGATDAAQRLDALLS